MIQGWRSPDLTRNGLRKSLRLIGASFDSFETYDTRDFVEGCRELNVTPHVAQNTANRSSRIEDRTTRHAGYVVGQRRRKRIEEVFGRMKTIGEVRKVRHRCREKVD